MRDWEEPPTPLQQPGRGGPRAEGQLGGVWHRHFVGPPSTRGEAQFSLYPPYSGEPKSPPPNPQAGAGAPKALTSHGPEDGPDLRGESRQQAE